MARIFLANLTQHQSATKRGRVATATYSVGKIVGKKPIQNPSVFGQKEGLGCRGSLLVKLANLDP